MVRFDIGNKINRRTLTIICSEKIDFSFFDFLFFPQLEFVYP